MEVHKGQLKLDKLKNVITWCQMILFSSLTHGAEARILTKKDMRRLKAWAMNCCAPFKK